MHKHNIHFVYYLQICTLDIIGKIYLNCIYRDSTGQKRGQSPSLRSMSFGNSQTPKLRKRY